MKFSHDFFTNKGGMNDKFIAMWERVFMFFLPENNVIGYDILNEPSGASAYRSTYEFIAPGMNNNKFLLPFYKKISRALRKIDKTKFLYFEPSVADILGGFYDSPSE
jgi:endoglycosylceramidase